ncbi:MAG: fumarylacetoacetate hydrolase family protein [Acidaminococcaceae bacterium]|nr:fumarylacetoacetate hydrolase family protein [Acidaminococcaceae bacterium]
MKLITYLHAGCESVGICTTDEAAVLPLPQYEDMNDLIVRSSLAELAQLQQQGGAVLPLGEVKVLAPIPVPKQDLICLGINYRAHSDEIAHSFGKEQLKKRNVPIYFGKRVNRAVAPGDVVDGHFAICDSLDYECELAVIIGKEAKQVAPEQVQDYIFGYTIVNDVSARNIQTAYKQWYFGKSLDDFTPMGPCIVTADAIAYPPKLNLSCSINGELRQNSNTELLVHDITYIVSELSQGMTLLPGTIIITGTPGGVGMGMQPPCFLHSGDVMECTIESIGTLVNKVK